MEITQPGLPGSGVHYVMTGRFQTPGFNGNRGSKSKFGVWINMSLLAAEILVNMTLNHVKNKQTSQKVLYDE